MFISKFQIYNYKSFIDSEEVELKQGINIITGKNNGGKTALIQALGLTFSDNPHRSTLTIPNRNSAHNTKSSISIEFDIEKSIIENYVLAQGQISIPLTEKYPIGTDFTERAFFDRLEERSKLKATFAGSQVTNVVFPSFGTTYLEQQALMTVNINSKKLIRQTISTGLPNIFSLFANTLKNRLYSFKAERFGIGKGNHGTNNILNPDASNLPEVLNNLQSNKYRFERYNSYIHKIFDSVYSVSVNASVSNQVELVVWNENPALERDDLCVPLSNSGTGIGQVLAILYVVLNSNEPTIILIDEPNSFLHPGASRKLMEILKEFPQHQFIVSTHSPEVVISSNPTTIHIVKNHDAQSKVNSIDLRENSNQMLYLAEIGSKLSDVFGADNILWVEGKTEEICLIKMMDKMAGVSKMGTSILSVKHTGDFEGKNSLTIFEIYDKLSKGKGLIPPSVGFIFDRENKTKKDMDNLIKRGEINKNKVIFTKRRMYENYLLNIKAIYYVLNSIDGISINESEINEWIDINKNNTMNFYPKDYVLDDKNWHSDIDGASFISALFSELTNTRVSYDKITHSVALTDWIIANSFDDLKEYQQILTDIFKVVN